MRTQGFFLSLDLRRRETQTKVTQPQQFGVLSLTRHQIQTAPIPFGGIPGTFGFPQTKKKESTCPPKKRRFFTFFIFGKSLEAGNLDSDRDRFMMLPNWLLVLPNSHIVVATTFPIKYCYVQIFYILFISPDSTARTTLLSSAMLFPSGTGST